ncbi:MAG: hypothetical protein WA652_06070, partial [Xanthobacteraceae bacterium]
MRLRHGRTEDAQHRRTGEERDKFSSPHETLLRRISAENRRLPSDQIRGQDISGKCLFRSGEVEAIGVHYLG